MSAQSVIVDPQMLRELANLAETLNQILKQAGPDWNTSSGELLSLSADDCDQVISLDLVHINDVRQVVVTIGPRKEAVT